MQAVTSNVNAPVAPLAGAFARFKAKLELPTLAKPRWMQAKTPTAVTTLMMGEQCLAVRVEAAREPGGKLLLVDVAEGTERELREWKQRKLFADSQAVLVLRSTERQFITIDRPEVQDHELQQAVRWPLAESMEAEADTLLTTALLLPAINNALKPQVLAIAARTELAKAHLVTLAGHGIKLRSIDMVDTALRGMALLQPSDNNGSVVLAFIGKDICIGLLWRGAFCLLRTLALPVRPPRDAADFEEHLALHIQRTTDHFERQATQLAVRHVLAAMPSLDAATRERVRGSLPMSAKLFDLDEHFEMSGVTREKVDGHNEFSALACVAAARLIDSGKPSQGAVAAAQAPLASNATPSLASSLATSPSPNPTATGAPA